MASTSPAAENHHGPQPPGSPSPIEGPSFLGKLEAVLAPLDPARPEVAEAVETELRALPAEPDLQALLDARARIWTRLGHPSGARGLHDRP